VIVFMTDGRANVARSGEGGRDAAEADALDAAQLLRIDGRLAVIVDTSPRPQADGRDLAAKMDALYLPLPRANSETLSDAVVAVTAGQR
jgi:magnesium chelatase subunit D